VIITFGILWIFTLANASTYSLYWATTNPKTGSGSVWTANSDGTNQTKLISNLFWPSGLTYVTTKTTAQIWIAEGNGISFINTDGTGYTKVPGTAHEVFNASKIVQIYYMTAELEDKAGAYYTVGNSIYFLPTIYPPFLPPVKTATVFTYPPTAPIVAIDLDFVFDVLVYATPTMAGMPPWPQTFINIVHPESGFGYNNINMIPSTEILDICWSYDDRNIYAIQSNASLSMIWSVNEITGSGNVVLEAPGLGAGGLTCSGGIVYFTVNNSLNPDYCTVNLLELNTGKVTQLVCNKIENEEAPGTIIMEY